MANIHHPGTAFRSRAVSNGFATLGAFGAFALSVGFAAAIILGLF